MTDAPAWARGYPLDFLKEVAAIYRAEFKPHTYGAFGLPKERDVADAMAENALLWTRSLEGNKPVEAVAIAKPVTRPSPHEDFAGRRVALQPGDIFVKSIAGTWDGKCRLLNSFAQRRGAGAIWVEAHVENLETANFLSTAGFDRVMTKVSASSDLKGLYVLGGAAALAAPPLDPADEPGVKVLRPGFITEKERADLLTEIEASREAFAQHYSGYNKRQSWTAFALRGFVAEDPGFIIKPAEMSRAWTDEHPALLEAACVDTVAAPAFPTAWRILERIPTAGYQRVRFMRLSAGGGELTRHADITDPEAGTAPRKLVRLHIPIRTNPGCVFRSWGLDGEERRLHMPEKGLSYIDTRKPHAVINPAEVERIHLVADAYSTEELRGWIRSRES